MSRSRKYPIWVCSNQIDKGKAHRAVRRRVKAELSKPEPDELVIEFDTRDIGKEDWGTKFDYALDDEEDKARASRK